MTYILHSRFPVLDSPCVLCIGKINEIPHSKVHNRIHIVFYNLWHDSEVWLYSSKMRKHRFLLPLQQYRYFRWHIPVVLRSTDLFIQYSILHDSINYNCVVYDGILNNYVCKSDVWLTVHRNSVRIRKTN